MMISLLSAPRLPVDDSETLNALRSFNRRGVHKGHHSLRRAAQFLEQQGTSSLHIPCYLDAFCKPITIRGENADLLESVTLPELQLNHWHQGKVLRGHLRARAFKFVKTVASVFEDGSGHAARVFVSSLVFPEFDKRDGETLLPEGAEFVIREPCLVESNIYCQGTCLWISNPASIQVRYTSTFDIPTSEAIHKLASQEFSKHNFTVAIELYTELVELNSGAGVQQQQEELSGLLNRAEAWFRVGYFQRALVDADRALELSPGHEKGLLTKVRALWKLHQYVEAEACLKESCASPLVERLHEQAKTFLKQSSSGRHDLSGFITGGCRKESVPTFAEYVGPVRVEMTDDGRGRGLFLTRDVVRGDLLLVSNAAVKVTLTKELKDKLDRGDSSDLVARLLQVCMGSPRTLEQVYSMAEQDPLQGVSKLVDKPAPSMELFVPDWDMTRFQKRELELDVIRIQNVLDCSTEFVLSEDYNDEFVGFWTLPAFINHSCLPNVCMRKFGRAMFVFAARDMKAGSELVRSYGYAMRPGSLRRSKSTFECKCPRCELEKQLEISLAGVSDKFTRLLKSRELTSEDCEEYASLAVEVEQVLKSEKVSEVERMWIRATYPAAYLAYHGCRDESVGEEVEEDMPSADDMLEALHETAPGDIMTLAMMYRYKSAGSERGMKFLKQEIWSAFGHLESYVMENVMEHLETGKIAATI